MALDKHKAPILPTPTALYSPAYFNQLLRTITSYFNIIDSKAAITHEQVSTRYLHLLMENYTAANGQANDVTLPKSSGIRIVGPSAAFGLSGITGGADGRMVILINTTAQNMTLYNQNASSTAENRIITGTGANLVTTGAGAFTLLYSVDDSRWYVVSAQL